MALNRLPLSFLSTLEKAAEGASIIWDATTQKVSVSETYQFQGSVSGYTSGGSPSNVIDKFPFASDVNATDVGDLTQIRYMPAGQSSNINGYTSGGYNTTTIDKFPFSSDGNAADVGDLTQARSGLAGQAYSVSGYSSGGLTGPPGNTTNTIDKFPFATDSNTTDVGNLTQSVRNVTGQSSESYGYTSGGRLAPVPTSVYTTRIERFPFASDANSASIGSLTQSRGVLVGQSSETYGYNSGGRIAPPSPNLGYVNTIDRFPFASTAFSSDVGDLIRAGGYSAGQSSISSGYNSGGTTTPPTIPSDVISKFPFATTANASDVGDLTQPRYAMAGQQK